MAFVSTVAVAVGAASANLLVVGFIFFAIIISTCARLEIEIYELKFTKSEDLA